MEIRKELERSLIYKNIDIKGRDLSDVLRGQLKVIDDILKMPDSIKAGKTAEEVVDLMVSMSSQGVPKKEK